LSLNRGGQLKAYRFIHFAVHGLQVDGNAALNALIFTSHAEARRQSPGAYNALRRKYGEASGDGYLRLNEIRSLRLNAELVVLSACETSLGHRLNGEGLVALPQSFLIAGARNVIASSWSVDDLATKDLMQETYRLLLRENATPAEALRAAALRLRAKYPDPFYWTAFAVYGE
jgi:CHAT domain-containing protein